MQATTRSVTIAELARLVRGEVVRGGGTALAIAGVTADSRSVEPGKIFVAIEGAAGDGHDFVAEAYERGALVSIASRPNVAGHGPAIVVRDSRLALSVLADWYYGPVSQQMLAIGVTGTNGKTTIHWILYHLLNALNVPALRLGTLGIHSSLGIDEPGNLTTPDPVSIHRALRQGFDLGARAFVMETSSHALDQRRVESIAFDVGVFTNLTRDHLDYHQTMEAYCAAKKRLVDLLMVSTKQRRLFVPNVDDPYGSEMAQYASSKGLPVYSFGRSAHAQVQIVGFDQGLRGSTLFLRIGKQELQLRSRYIGAHNAENLAAVIAVAVAQGWDMARVTEVLPGLPMVPGRLEPVGTDRLGVYVDYAHSPDALEKVLQTLRPLTRGKLWVVFGCGGDRDRGKRPQMAAVAAQLADRVMVTSDNPRTEVPEAIIADILQGTREVWGSDVDRRSAIQRVIRAADPGDVVLIAGKGHEDYQIIGKVKHHFSDQEEACLALALRERGACSIV